MILFKKIRWKNFLSTGNVFTEILLNSNKTTLIIGENGAGKSTLLDALSFGLFGKEFRNVNKAQLINSITQKNCVVEVEFSIGSNEFKIIRGQKPTIFEVYQNGTLLNQSADSGDYQDTLEKTILKVTRKSFNQIVILGAATFQPFMQLPKGERRKIVEDLLDLEIFTKMNVLLKDRVSDNSQSLTECNLNKKSTEEKIALVKTHLKEMQSNTEDLINDRKLKIDTNNSKIENLNIEYQKLHDLIKEKKNKLGNSDDIQKKLSEFNSLYHKIDANLSQLKKDINFFNKNHDCPTCKQEIDEKFRCDTISNKEKEIEDISEGLKLLSKKIETYENKLKEYKNGQKEIDDLRFEENKLKTNINSLKQYIEDLNDEIRNLINKNKKIDDSKISELENELVTLENSFNELSDNKQVLTAISALLKDSGIKAKIIKQYIPVINKLINKYLSAMEFMCQFELNEEFVETIKSRYRDEFSYESFSEGEKMRINLAVLFTWRAIAKMRNSINTNILIMDEVFDSSLDLNGTEEFMKILNNLTGDTNTFIISHKTDQLYDKFEKTIRFEKHKNFSRIV